ncbi:chitin synthase-like [Physella acuta]|uniref:chitin synthase-like n=1 Tax=Physella acuta TaxID=109671 RepID=UPI0027DABD5F|nr:chitin synthase-like [Physella acuta]
MFTVPGYGSVLLESWLLVLTYDIRAVVRRSSVVLGDREKIKADRVFVCTTMYRESENEMRDYLQSLAELSSSLQPSDPEFEAHIFFDDAVSKGYITEYAVKLFAVAREVLDFSSSFKEMPYGQQHKCLNISKQKHPQGSNTKFMPLTIHLKDNSKVLGKKRWSQVMFMNYVTDNKFLNQDDDSSFILTTDGDVSFKPGAVRALIKQLQADNNLGAVCSRIIPDGEGPLYWFQSFEYALDHWLQKTTEHVLGSVLCAPGCFSLYRCSAICDVLKTYSQPARSAMDFLTRDMGEDRWLCSLMVQEGCGIAYCQDARVTTHCPTNFEEFFKQRRRWIASSLANVYLLLKDRNKLRQDNPRVSEIFLMYQLLHFVTALLSPTAVLIIVAGGVSYAFGAPSYIIYIVIALVELNFTLFCLKGNHRTQLVVSQFYAILFPAMMWAVFVGIIAQLAASPSSSDQSHSTSSQNKISSSLLDDSDSGVDLPFTAGYILATFGVVLVTGILQGRDCLQLIHGCLFVFSLPCLYLLMTLYTVSNLTDLSWAEVRLFVYSFMVDWLQLGRPKTELKLFKSHQQPVSGTRQDMEAESEYFIQTWIKLLKSFISFFRCRCNFSLSKPTDLEIPIVTAKEIAELDLSPDKKEEKSTKIETKLADPSSDKKEEKSTKIETKLTESADDEEESDEENEDTDETDGVSSDYLTIDKWLPDHLRIPYAAMFKKHGYTTTNFLTSLTEADLVKLGVDKKGIRMFLMAEIRKLPSFQLKINIKAGINQFLKDTGLQSYLENFKANCLDTAEGLQTLKHFTEDDIKDLGIKKPGHVKRLMSAIAMLRLQDHVYTTEQEDHSAPKIAEGGSATSINVVDEDITTLASPDERDFRAQWAGLIERTLNPDHGHVVSSDTITENLQRLKINAIKCLIATNAVLFVFTIVLTFFSRFSKVVVGIDPVSFAVLLLYALLMLLQFLGMLIYNLSRFCNKLSRASYGLKRFKCINTNGGENSQCGETRRLNRGETISLLREGDGSATD